MAGQTSRTKMLLALLAPAADGKSTRAQKVFGVFLVTFFSVLFAMVNAPSARKKARGSKATTSDDLKLLLKILVPSPFCRQASILYSFIGVLTVRTLLSIFVAHLDGRVVKALVEMKLSEFGRLVCVWLCMGVPASICNALIKHLQGALAITFRTTLTKHFYDLYFKSQVYYKVGCLDDRIENPDQMMTDDAEKFSKQLADLISQLAKPAFDCLIFTAELWKSVGSGAVAGAYLTTVLTAQALNALRPSFGRLTAETAERDGQWRARHTRLVTDSEEVAFHGGAEVERLRVEDGYRALVGANKKLLTASFPYNVIEGYFTKYLWGIVGMTVCAAPVLVGGGKVGAGTATEILVTNRKLMTSAADSTERLMESLKDMSHLSGRAGRLANLIRVLREVDNGQYKHRQVGVNADPSLPSPSLTYHGKTHHVEDYIEFIDVPIVAPNGELLVKPTTFRLNRGDHCLIIGPNGCGKSSLFRVLAGLWPVMAGELYRPTGLRDIFFLPQRAYLVQGTLEDQIIYPDTKPKCTREELKQMMSWACCKHVLDREELGFDTAKEWKDVLSGGERQKIGLARVFYHKPKFAILDECTSQIHVDDEQKLYSKVKELGITLMSVSHRRTIWHHHSCKISFENREITFSKTM
ncbi:Peroxisomal long-chain fatty acid import protein 2 [Diplonema papillatum]|nr:Peroxisomal long-chain fatty acid import protein 2 [Diplonema papillatum]